MRNTPAPPDELFLFFSFLFASSHQPPTHPLYNCIAFLDYGMTYRFASGVGREELERRVTELETDGSPGDFVIGDVTGEPQCYGGLV